MYTSLWVFIAVLAAVVLAIAGERFYRQVTKMTSWIDIPLVVAKTCGKLCFLAALPAGNEL